MELAEEQAFAKYIEQVSRETGFAFGPRGWAYLLEGKRIITKQDFAACERVLARLRKEGVLDPDVVAVDDARVAEGGETFVDRLTPEQEAELLLQNARDQAQLYSPISWWEGLDTYIEVFVEKVDLKVLWRDTCADFKVPITNARGDTDINSRRFLLKRLREHHEAGRRCVLLYAGDHDPKGLHISDGLLKNIASCGDIKDVQWSPVGKVEVERIALNRGQIIDAELTWIDNLITGGSKVMGKDGRILKTPDLADPNHPSHDLDYVQTYLADQGPRKVEANALAANPEAARSIIFHAITKYIPPNWRERHADRLQPARNEVLTHFERLIREAAK